MVWVMNNKNYGRGGVHFFIGSVKIAEVQMIKIGLGWKYFLRLMHSTTNPDVPDHYDTFSAALTDLHRLLNKPGPGIVRGIDKTPKEEEDTP